MCNLFKESPKVIDLGFATGAAGLDASNVVVMLGMLESIHDEVDGDDVMTDFASTIHSAISQLRGLQQLAYQTMIEIEAERALGRKPRRLTLVRGKGS
jgi:predicted site-specific integrase-resolvase